MCLIYRDLFKFVNINSINFKKIPLGTLLERVFGKLRLEINFKFGYHLFNFQAHTFVRVQMYVLGINNTEFTQKEHLYLSYSDELFLRRRFLSLMEF